MASTHPISPSNSSSSPPLPNMHALSISPFPSQGLSNGDYRFNGVFGPPSQDAGWNGQNKRTSRNGLPANWYDPSARDSHNQSAFDSFRRDSPPTLSPPSSTTSAPTTSSSQLPYAYLSGPGGFPDAMTAFSSVGVSPSPPPLGYGMSSGGYNVSALPQYGSQQMPPPSHSRANNGIWTRNGYGGSGAIPPLDDDVIPTAIVIKNIPFAVAREHLLGVIESLGAPLPYAFNYHHDNGIFRGLAFANFRAPDEAASVVAALNGYDVQGRKLRVEYKKVLQPGEKDKIEREKALKRMRSIQFDHAAKDMPPPPLNIPNHNRNNLSIGIQQQNGRLSADLEYSPPHSASSATSENLPMSLDLNDPVALDIYSRVLVFKEDRMRDELAFSKSLNPTERRIVHLVAQKLGLTSITKGDEGEIKYVVVTRESHRPPLNSASSATTASSSTYLSPYSAHQTDLSPSLRIKKSMPDLRGFNGPVVARDPTRSLNPQRSSGNLRGDNVGGREFVSMGAAGGRRVIGYGSGNFNSYFGAPVDIPPVPPLPTNLTQHQSRGSMSANTAASASSSSDSNDYNAAPLRNPRGPVGDNTRGFGGVRHSASAILRGSSAHGGASSNTGSLSLGRRVSEEEDNVQSQALERLRSRESAVEV